VKTEPITLPLSELVEDFDLYPRPMVDSNNVTRLRHAIRAGVSLPPITIDRRSKRITDGLHRRRAYRAELGSDARVACEAKDYKNEGEMFLDAIRLNAPHGKPLSPFDKARCVLKCKTFRIGMKQMSEALGMPPDVIQALGEGRTAKVSAGEGDQGGEVVLKRTVAHMSGQTLTENQREANKRLSGMQQAFYVNQVLILIENDMLDTADETLMEALGRLAERLNGIFAAA